MIFEYFIHTINNNNTYTYIVKHNNNNIAVNIDLIQNYPSYVFIDNTYNNSKWHYYVVSSDNKNKGDIEEIDVSLFKRTSYPRNIIYKNTEYIIANQYQYDKYLYFINTKNDNSKLFNFMYNYIIRYYKNEYKTKRIKTYKETIV
jgi:hypothetical protein